MKTPLELLLEDVKNRLKKTRIKIDNFNWEEPGLKYEILIDQNKKLQKFAEKLDIMLWEDCK